MRPETLAVHAGGAPDAQTGAMAPPLHLATTFAHGPAGDRVAGYEYTREGKPTQDRLETPVARVESRPAALALAWLLDRAPHILPIPGTRTPDHLRAWTMAPEIDLSDDDREEIDRILPIGWAWGDRYSTPRTRGGPRGIGGRFFDDLNEWVFDTCFAFIRAIGDAYVNAYLPIIQRRKDTPFTPQQREFQEYRPYASIQQFRREIGKYVDAAQVADYEKYVFVPIGPNEADEATLLDLPGVDAAIAEQPSPAPP